MSNVVQSIHQKGRLFFVTDVHGELQLLLRALELVGFVYGEDTLVCAGDMIDRGQHSFETLKWFSLGKPYGIHSCMGNHEDFALDYLSNPITRNLSLWVQNGGGWFLDDVQRGKGILSIVRNLPLAIEVETNSGYKIGVIHAEMPEYNCWDTLKHSLNSGCSYSRTKVLWGREIIGRTVVNEPFCVTHMVHGHTVVPKAKIRPGRLYLDTGACFDYIYENNTAPGGLSIAEFIDSDNDFKITFVPRAVLEE